MRQAGGAGGGAAAAGAPLIGRDGLLAELRGCVARTAGGNSCVVLLTGLPGVGKSRLAGATLTAAGDAGFATFAGRARPLSRDVAYAPLVEAFGPQLRAMAQPRRTEVLADLNQLALVLAGLGVEPPPPLGDPALERSRLLDAFGRLLERLAGDRPIALLLDDAHAVDDATAAFLVHLVTSSAERPALLVLTARTDAADRVRTDVLTGALAESSWWLAQHAVEPLAAPAAATLVRSVAGTMDDRLVERVVQRCAGRPLLLDAVARTLAEQGPRDARGALIDLPGAGVPVPDDLLAQLRARLTGCTPAERELLDLLAVAGDAVAFPTVLQVSGLDADTTVSGLDGLQRRGLVQESDAAAGGGFDLAHGLLRGVIAADVSRVATQRIHARLFAALARADSDDARLAEHALGAGPLLDPERAADQLARGGHRARELGMNEAALRYLGAAVELADEQGDLRRSADLLADLADTHRRLGRPQDARVTWQRALSGYAQSGRMDGVARVEQELGMLEWSTAELASAHEHFDRAEAALAGLEPSTAHAAMLFTRTVIASRIGDARTATDSARELRQLAAELGSDALAARAYLAESVVSYGDGDYVAMTEKNLLALAAAERSGDPLLVIRAHDQLSVAAASQLDLAGLRQHSQASLTAARQLGALILEPWPRGRIAVADLLAGDWDAALRATSELVGVARRHHEHRGAVSSAAGHAWLLTHLGRLADARRLLAEARAGATPMLEKDRNIFSIVAIAETWLALTEDEPDRAVECGTQLADTTGGWLPLLGLALLGEARVRAGDVTGGRELAARFAQARSCTVAPQTLGSWVSGLADAAAGDAAAAVCHLLEASDGFRTLSLPFHAARMQLLAGSTNAGIDPPAAIEQARAALPVFDELGAPVEAQRTRDLLRGLGVVPSRGRRRTRESGSALSARELEVARAVASGQSNADVATALFISPRTVTTHLDRIYARLGISSRTALTRYLADSGLLDDTRPASSSDAANT